MTKEPQLYERIKELERKMDILVSYYNNHLDRLHRNKSEVIRK